jgi:hypothetical protein
VSQEEEKPNYDREEIEQLTPRMFRDELDDVIEEYRDDNVAKIELMDIMWSRIRQLDKKEEKETEYVWEERK